MFRIEQAPRLRIIGEGQVVLDADSEGTDATWQLLHPVDDLGVGIPEMLDELLDLEGEVADRDLLRELPGHRVDGPLIGISDRRNIGMAVPDDIAQGHEVGRGLLPRDQGVAGTAFEQPIVQERCEGVHQSQLPRRSVSLRCRMDHRERGSKARRTASPSITSASTVTVSTRLGKSSMCGAVAR